MGVRGIEAAKMEAMAKKKMPKPEEANHSKQMEEKEEAKQMEVMVGTEENLTGWANNWDETRPRIGDFVEEQMSWGSVWSLFWLGIWIFPMKLLMLVCTVTSFGTTILGL